MKRLVLILLMFAVMLVIATPSFAKTKAQKQADVRKLADQTLAMRRGPREGHDQSGCSPPI